MKKNLKNITKTNKLYNLKVALVHDYLKDFGGAERVLLALSQIWPKAPIYTAFYKSGSLAHNRFKDKNIISSWAQRFPGFIDKLHSPLRFLAPQIWESFDFDDYDLVISSTSWYITKGIITRPETLHICYCHTPPRYLYGYPTSVQWQRYWLVRQYAKIVNKYLRQYDYLSSQRVDYFIANSKNTKKRIKKFYKRDSTVIYPPVNLPIKKSTSTKKSDFYLLISRIVGGKGLSLAIKAANKLNINLKIVGKSSSWSKQEKKLKSLAGPTVEFLGYKSDSQLVDLYSSAKAFLALAEDEDFGITPVEAMLSGTPVIAYKGGGYLETVIQDKTGVFFNSQTPESLISAINHFNKNKRIYNKKLLKKHAQKFSNKVFKQKITAFVNKKLKEHNA